MKSSKRETESTSFYEMIMVFAEKAPGLKARDAGGYIEIEQALDSKRIKFSVDEVSEVLNRFDSDNKPFVQVNFQTGKKILLTDDLVGFKPIPQVGLESDKLPKVVTTPDLVSVFEAAEEAIHSDSGTDEVETLKKVFFSILIGGEAIGFDLASEREWFRFLSKSRASA